MKIVDLFAGVGGFSLGAAAAGHDVVLAVEADPRIAELHELNLPEIPVVVEELGREKPAVYARRLRTFGRIHLHGSPPCQKLSVANKTGGDTRKGLRLVRWFLDVVDALKPSSWSMEQVPNKKLLAFLEKRAVPFHIVDCSDHQVPQRRRRVIAGTLKVVRAMRRAEGTGPTVLPKDVLTKLKPARRYSLQNGTDNESVHRDGKYQGTRPKRPDEGLRSLDQPAHTVWRKPGKIYDHTSWKTLRLLSIGEMARLQGFPSCFKFGLRTRAMQVVGNSLPPPLAISIVRAL